MADPLKIIVLEGDETGQELLEQAIRVLDPDVLGAARSSSSTTTSRWSTGARPTTRSSTRPPRAMREAGFGLKAATITPEGKDDVGSPNRILREEVDGKVIIRTGRRIPGVVGPVSRRALPDLRRADGGRGRLRRQAVARGRGGRRRRGRLPDREDHALDLPRGRRVRVPHRRAQPGARVYGGPKWTVSPVYEGMLKEELDAAAARHPDVDYRPVLIDATYAGLITGAADTPLVIPALNRDGDCLSDLVLPMFGSIAGAESVLLAFDDDYAIDVAMAEAPHGTAPSLHGQGPRQPDGDDPGLRGACSATPARRAIAGAERASRAIYESVLETTAGGSRRSTSAARADHDGVHRRRGREGPDQGRDLVVARLDALSERAVVTSPDMARRRTRRARRRAREHGAPRAP